MIVPSLDLRLFRCKGKLTAAQYFSRTLRETTFRGENYDDTNQESYPQIDKHPTFGFARQPHHCHPAVRPRATFSCSHSEPGRIRRTGKTRPPGNKAIHQ